MSRTWLITGCSTGIGRLLVERVHERGERVVAIAVCHSGAIEEGERVLKPLRGWGTPLADSIAPMAYTAAQCMFDAGFPSGLQNYWKSNFLARLDDTAIELMVDHVLRCPSPGSAVAIEQLGGAVSRIGKDETAFKQTVIDQFDA